MPAPIPLSSIITSATRRANIENFVGETGTFITNPELRDYANEYGAELYDELVAVRGNEYFRRSFTMQTNPNQSGYPLPQDFYELLSIDIYVAPNQVLSARPYMEEERNRFRWYPGWFYNLPVYFRMQGSATSTSAVLQPGIINFIPTPSSVNQVVLNYMPAFTPWPTDGSGDGWVIDGVNGWESFVTWSMAAVCLEKMQKNSAFAVAKAEAVRDRIRAMAPDREAGDAERVHDVSADLDPFGWGVI